MRDVQALAAQLSAERGVERPSQTSIRTRFGRRPTEVDIVNRLKLDCDLVIDLCPLAISVIDDDDNVAMADRKSVVEGKNVSERLYRGGRRTIKKKKIKE